MNVKNAINVIIMITLNFFIQKVEERSKKIKDEGVLRGSHRCDFC